MLAASIMVLSRFSFVLFADWWLGSLGEKWGRFRERRALNRELLDKDPKPAEQGGPIIKPLQPSAPPSVTVAKKEKKRESEKTAPLQEAFDFVRDDGNYRTPPLSLLDAPPAAEKRLDKEALTMNARLLEKKLKDFGVEGEVVEICPGPVVTMYEFAPGPGIKVSRIAGLSDDLSMALQALSIRIVAPIPGKGVVGDRAPQPGAGDGLPEGDLRRRGVPQREDEAPPGARQGHLRRAAGDRPGPHAAPPGGRRHRFAANRFPSTP